MAEAIEWVARIVTVALVMVVPGLVGHWLDGRFGTHFLVIIGFIFGLTSGVWYLLTMTGVASQRGLDRPKDKDEDSDQ